MNACCVLCVVCPYVPEEEAQGVVVEDLDGRVQQRHGDQQPMHGGV